MCYSKTLSNCLHAWKDIGAPDTVLEWLQDGVKLPFSAEPAPFELPNRQLSTKHSQFVDGEIT